jgi:hypothetical protein
MTQDEYGQTAETTVQIQHFYSFKFQYHTPAMLFLYKNTATRCHWYKADDYITEL